jgi:hypothetical protein
MSRSSLGHPGFRRRAAKLNRIASRTGLPLRFRRLGDALLVYQDAVSIARLQICHSLSCGHACIALVGAA